MEFLSDYGLFLAKLVSLVAGILIAVAGIIALSSKDKKKQKGKLEVTKINKKFKEYTDTLLEAVHDKQTSKQLKKSAKAAAKKAKNAPAAKRLFVLNFHGDIRASAVNALREEVTALLLLAKPEDEVLLRLESGGGLVNAYGLAASQLQRIKDAKIKLTIAVDKVAASGGYMMACVADYIIAAPFSIIGSIGVLAQLPNFHRLLKKNNIDFEQIMAGQYKRTLTVLGENTKDGRDKMQQEVDETHDLFKSFIKMHRSDVDIQKVATGEHWYGSLAYDLALVDELRTSDDFLLTRSKDTDIFEINFKLKKSLSQRLSSSAINLYDQLGGSYARTQPRS